jgi:hypothetical protein
MPKHATGAQRYSAAPPGPIPATAAEIPIPHAFTSWLEPPSANGPAAAIAIPRPLSA